MLVFICLCLIVGGILMVVYAGQIVQTIGSIELAERYLGVGGTYPFIKLVGLLLTVLSFVYLVGGFDGLASSQAISGFFRAGG